MSTLMLRNIAAFMICTLLCRETCYAIQSIHNEAINDFESLLKIEPNIKSALYEVSRVKNMVGRS